MLVYMLSVGEGNNKENQNQEKGKKEVSNFVLFLFQMCICGLFILMNDNH